MQSGSSFELDFALVGPGSYQDNFAQSACKLCPAGQFQPITGSSFSSSGATVPGKYMTLLIPFASCLFCQSCLPCVQGTWNPNQGQSVCLDCAPGLYGN